MKINGKPDGGGGGGVITSLSITSNGTYTAGQGVDGYSPVTVEVEPDLQDKNVTENGEYTADQGYDGLGTVTVSVPGPVTETLSVVYNGTYNPGTGVDGFSQVVVDVPQSVTGYTEKEITERNYYNITDLNNSASFVSDYAFYGNFSFNTVTLNNCMQIGSHAFQWTAGGSPRGIGGISIPNCTYIGNGAFNSCTRLSYAYCPKVQIIESYAFYTCYNLTEITLPEVVILNESAFLSCINLSSVYLGGYVKIGSAVFSQCNNIETFDGQNIIYINGNAFNKCSKLQSINIPLCSTISGSAFSYCSSLSKVYAPLAGYTYSNCGFSTCSLLNEVTIGADLYFVPSYVSLGTNFIANNGVINVDAEMYDKWLSVSGWFSMSNYIVSYISTDNSPMLSLSDGLLYGRTGYIDDAFYAPKNLSISKNLITNISLTKCKYVNNAFFDCNNLLNVSLPECVYINNPFSRCYYLSSVFIPKCEMISGNFAFDCGNSYTVTLGGSKVCKLFKNNAFQNVSSIYVPSSLVDSYKSAPYWSEYSNKIFPIQ